MHINITDITHAGLQESTYGTAMRRPPAVRLSSLVRPSRDERLCEHEILFI